MVFSVIKHLRKIYCNIDQNSKNKLGICLKVNRQIRFNSLITSQKLLGPTRKAQFRGKKLVESQFLLQSNTSRN